MQNSFLQINVPSASILAKVSLKLNEVTSVVEVSTYPAQLYIDNVPKHISQCTDMSVSFLVKRQMRKICFNVILLLHYVEIIK